MKKLILIGGDLAGGKSRFSNLIGEKFQLFVINKDRIKEILGDYIFAENRKENKKLSVISFQIMKYIVEKNQGTLVLESNFKEEEMKELRELTHKLGYCVLSFKLKGNDEILHDRFMKRLEQNRHYVHKSQDFSNINDFVETLNELRKVEYIGRVIEVDCSDFSYQEDVELYQILQTFLSS